MGERKGQNKYYPPDFDHKKHFSLNAYHGVHALRERGAKAHEGIIIIRFEMPFNCWCLTCKKPIGMGVRYNSEKTKVGNFYSTPIFQFKMTCHLCAGEILIQTDPEHFQYVIVSGARRREQRYDPKDVELPELDDSYTKSKMATDPMFHLEHASKDEETVKNVKPNLKKMIKLNEGFYDDFRLNQIARKQFREEKKLTLEKEKCLQDLSKKMSLEGGDVKLLPISEQDHNAAKFHIKSRQTLLYCVKNYKMLDRDIDMSSKAIEKRKAQLIKNLKSKTIKKPASRFLPFVKGLPNSKNLLKQAKSKFNQLSNTEQKTSSLVSEDYYSSDENHD